MDSFNQQIKQCSEQLKTWLKGVGIEQTVSSFVILGSGLNDLVNDFDVIAELSYQEIDGLPSPSTPSHEGKFSVVKVDDRIIIFCHGRFHLYEGYSAQQSSILVFIMHELGAKQMIVTNAAGALNSNYSPGDAVLIQDHINLTGHNPLRGLNLGFTNIFADMSEAYNRELLDSAKKAASKCKVSAHVGIYAAVLGPSLETSAERRMLRNSGADIVGMSTAMEVIAANSCDMKVLGISAITNMATGSADQGADTIEEVLENAAKSALGIGKIIKEVIN